MYEENYNDELYDAGSNNEHQLIHLFREGDGNAVKSLFEKFYQPLVYFATKIIANSAEAEDITSDSFCKLYLKRLDFDTIKDIKSFLFTANRNACYNILRARRAHTASHEEINYLSKDDTDKIYSEHLNVLILEELKQQIEILPPVCKNIFELIYYQGKSTEEVAGELGISRSNVLSQKSRAVKLLRTALFTRHLMPSLLTQHLLIIFLLCIH